MAQRRPRPRQHQRQTILKQPAARRQDIRAKVLIWLASSVEYASWDVTANSLVGEDIATLERRLARSGVNGSPERSNNLKRKPGASSGSYSGEASLCSPQGNLSGDTEFFTSLPDVALPSQARSDIPIQPSASVDFTALPIIAEDTFNYAGVFPTMQGPSHQAFREIEPLMRADLDQLYFDRAHAFTPFLQQSQYIRISRETNQKPTSNADSGSEGTNCPHACLQYAMWAIAASLSSHFHHMRETLYREALERLKALDSLDNPVEKEDCLLRQAQAWILIAIYELMQVGFRRAWVSTGRAIRLVQLMRLSSVDASWEKTSGLSEDPGSFVETEEKRRTFWMALCLDTIICVVHDLLPTLAESESTVISSPAVRTEL
ncbi:all development altered-6 [Colletotrichum orchidophilum]|uniref:All development altered-6 n=1 Tax=Colletotrichum orchidophilum TaxID=1209926 RepID=A0A1G4AYL9_9PEZI|nr:all development altered-6 [Colletotrichum orchidophilum]OHE94195.1 all development altered-6 [Colletotrichum orchidophilum]